MHLQNLPMLHLLWLLPILVGIFWAGERVRHRRLAAFLPRPALLRRPAPDCRWRRRGKASLFITACGLLVIGLARPAWNEQEVTVSRQGRDVVFLLDVSKSMLAEDLVPNRLERAKLAIKDAVEVLAGDRVAMVAFAGEARVTCPLTSDYGFFRLALDQVGIDSANRGGTLMGDAIRTVLDRVFDQQASQHRDIVLITDGGDHESLPIEAAKAAGEKGIRLIIIGLGDEQEGRRIPIIDAHGRKSFLTYQGREVWTKLDADTLRQMAMATPGGRYLPVATGTIDLGRVYRELIAEADKQEYEATTFHRLDEKFQFFLAAALFLLFWEMMLGETKNMGPNTVKGLTTTQTGTSNAPGK